MKLLMKEETTAAMVFALLLAGGALLLFPAAAHGQRDPCSANANYVASKKAADIAQRELAMRERALPESFKRELARSPGSVDEKLHGKFRIPLFVGNNKVK